jgi:hypothetical protein
MTPLPRPYVTQAQAQAQARTISGDEIVRMVDTVVVGDVCSTITRMLSNITHLRNEQVEKFIVHDLRIPEHRWSDSQASSASESSP